MTLTGEAFEAPRLTPGHLENIRTEGKASVSEDPNEVSMRIEKILLE